MTSNIIARRYAGALFAIGREQGAQATEAYAAALNDLSGLIASSPDLGKLLRAPVISAAEKNGAIDAILLRMGAGPVMSSFCHLLSERNRLEYLPAITEAYAALLDDERGVVRGKVVTAAALPAGQQRQLSLELERKAGRTTRLTFDVDPDILGGVVLYLGDSIMDASLRAQLNSLIDTIKRGE